MRPPKGRCAGCGLIDASCKKVESHILGCPEFIRLFQEDPDKVLGPEAEYRRYQEWLQSPEGRAKAEEEKAEKFRGFRSAGATKVRKARERWGTKGVRG